MSFRIIKPLYPKKNNIQLKNNPPYQHPYILPLQNITGSILPTVNRRSNSKSFTISNLQGSKIIPDLSGQFGWSLDTDRLGRYAVIGAPTYNSMTGYSSIYSIQNNTATSIYTTSQIQTANNMIGFAVSISGNGNVIAVSAPGYNVNVGGVLIYTNINGTISYSTLIAPSGSAGDYLGQYIKLNNDGTILVIGAPLSGSNSGKVLIYRNTGSWNLVQTIINPVGTSYFGDDIDMLGDSTKIFITSRISAVGGISCRTYIYNYSSSSGQWTLSGTYPYITTTITTGLSISNVDFNIKCSQQGSFQYLVVSSPNQNNTQGIVNIYTLGTENQLLYTTTLFPDTGETGFGYKISNSGDCKTIYVSSATDDSNEGQIWIYRQSEQFPTTWIRVLEPFRGSNDIGFPQQGFSISCNYNGAALVIGGPFDNNNKGASWSFI
jgi:hypothetical protein